MGIFTKMFGTRSERELKRIEPIVAKTEALEEEYKALPSEALRAKTAAFRARLAAGETLDDLLPEALATAREGAFRVIGQRAFHVQLLGAVVLHQGRIAEMKTGEGKTLTATLCAYVNGLAGEGVHIVTVNDYLAKRDSEWMGKVHRFLGLTVGLVIHDTDGPGRKAAYAADITYGTNNEMGFDYLRDNMALYAQEMVQRGHAFAIVDEVDSILIDEARTPLIISGMGDESTQLYQIVDDFASKLKPLVIASVDDKEEEADDLDADYVVDEKARTVTLTARGIAKAEKQFALENLSDPENTTIAHHINQAIRARGIMRRDVDYVVREGEVIIVDEFTGRLMFGRRYSDGLHQAIEAKEHVVVARESKTLATITFQNYFRLYRKLSGMTGTALTEEEEFSHTYSLDIVEIPTNRPMIRRDRPDVVYRCEAGKYRAIIRQIAECHGKGQPVLVGTISIEKSELLSKLLSRQGIRHNVLNAKFHEKEAEIVAQAGQPGAVTVATNMAGRGTDIMLGGNSEYLAKADLRKAGYSEGVIAEATGFADTDSADVLEARRLFAEAEKKYKASTDAEAEKVRAAGGLFILGTERHESRRIDNQIRGRAGRQGDPGESRFFLSMEDDIMRLFGSERVMGMMDSLGVDEDTPIDAKILSGAIENAQKRVESRNFQSRKNVLEYDDVMNVQRKVIYEQRRKVLDGEDLRSAVENMINAVIENAVRPAFGEQHHLSAEAWRAIRLKFEGVFLGRDELQMDAETLASKSADDLIELLRARAFDIYQRKEQSLGAPLMRELERVSMLRVVDLYWMDHIDAMDELRRGIGLQAYGQTDPVVEYKRVGYDMFEQMNETIREETVRQIFIRQVRTQSIQREKVAKITGTSGGSDGTVKKQPVKKDKKVGPNDPCPCGSGKKYKQCCRRKDLGAEN